MGMAAIEMKGNQMGTTRTKAKTAARSNLWSFFLYLFSYLKLLDLVSFRT